MNRVNFMQWFTTIVFMVIQSIYIQVVLFWIFIGNDIICIQVVNVSIGAQAVFNCWFVGIESCGVVYISWSVNGTSLDEYSDLNIADDSNPSQTEHKQNGKLTVDSTWSFYVSPEVADKWDYSTVSCRALQATCNITKSASETLLIQGIYMYTSFT